MAIIAQHCLQVRSSWVRKLILTCDTDGTGQHLAVSFKRWVGPHHHIPNLTCLYPQTDKRFYDIGSVFPSKGHFVHRFLYRKMPYRLIADPCPQQACTVTVGCCGNPIPLTLHCTFSGGFGTCVNLDGTTIAVSWNATNSRWEYNGPLIGTNNCSVYFWCDNTNTWQSGGANNSAFDTTAATSVTCSPISLSFTMPLALGPPGQVCSGNIVATVTT
jgi:hypothetical protein